MRSTLTALVVVAGVLGFGATAQAAPVPVGAPGVGTPVELAQLTRHERRMIRHHRAERRMMRREVKKRMIRRQIRREMRGM